MEGSAAHVCTRLAFEFLALTAVRSGEVRGARWEEMDVASRNAEGKCPNETKHRQVKYLDNVVEADHGKFKLLIRPVRGFKTLTDCPHRHPGLTCLRS